MALGNLARMATILGRSKAAFNQGRIKRDQQDFDNERELARERLNEAFRRDQLEARNQQAAESQAFREAQLAQQRALSEENRSANMERLRLQLGEREAQAQRDADLRREMMALTTGTQRDIARMNLEGRENLARLGAQLKQPTAGKILPSNLVDKLAMFNAMVKSASGAKDKFDRAVAAGKDVTGPIRGRVTGSLGQMLGLGTDPLEVSARGAMTNIASQIMKERSGGAITPQEFERLEPFLDMKNVTEGVAAQKLVDLINELHLIREERLNALEGSGYDVSGLRAKPAGAGTGYRPTNPFVK